MKIKIEFKKFPTHAQLTKTKSIKINSQNIFNGKLHSFSRAKVVEFMKKEFSKSIPKNLKIDKFPIGMFMEIHVPLNYGNVRLSKGIVKWLPMQDETNYKPKNDLDNMTQIWSKCAQDVLVSKKVIPDDTIGYVKMLGYKFIPCKTLDDRKIVISLIPIENILDILETVTKSNLLSIDDLEILNSLLNF